MSENIPESVPTSQDPRSKRPIKRRALSPASKQASEVEALFANPEREVNIPAGTEGHKSNLPPPPEIVANVQGSSAGAGSGEFHVYKASRRREYERLKQMDEETAQEQANVEFEKKRAEQNKKDEERTEKNRKKREKLKQRKGVKGKNQQEDGIDTAEKLDQKSTVAQKNGDESRTHSEAVLQNGGGDQKVKEVGVMIHDDD